MPPYTLPQLTDQLHRVGPQGRQPEGGAMLAPELEAGPHPRRWLEAEFYGNSAHPIQGQGGRGAAWFVTLPNGLAAALRHYRRGGLPARLGLQSRYLWRGEEATRCLNEFRLLHFLRQQKLAVPRPLAAGWWRQGLFYRQALLTEQIPHVRSLAQLLQNGDMTAIPWVAIGVAVARLHRCFVVHPDLNAHNILIDQQGVVWLIDFDRGTIVDLNPGKLTGNLFRLERSVRKLLNGPTPRQWQDLYEAWRDAFDGKPPKFAA